MVNARPLAVMSLAAGLLMIGVGMTVPLLPQRMLELSGSSQNVGYLSSVFALSYLLVLLPIGRLADRCGAKVFLIGGCLLCAVTGVLFHFAQTSSLFLIARLLQGAAEAPLWALGPALLTLCYPQAKGKVIGVYNAATHAGLTLGPLFGLLLLASNQTDNVFFIFALLALLAAVLMLLLPTTSAPTRMSEVKATQFDNRSATLAGVFRIPAVRLMCPSVLLYGAVYGVFMSVLPAYLVEAKGFNTESLSVFFALFYLAISLSQWGVGPLSDRYGRTLFMVTGLLLTALSLTLIDWLNFYGLCLALIFSSLGLGTFCVAAMAHLNESVSPTLKSSVSSGFYLVWGLGFCFGPLVVAALSRMFTATWAYTALAALIVAVALALLLSVKGRDDHTEITKPMNLI